MAEYSSATWAYPGEQTSNISPIVIFTGVSAVLGKIVLAVGAEERLARLAPTWRGTGTASPGDFWLLSGAVLLSAAYGYSLSVNGNGRRIAAVPLPYHSPSASDLVPADASADQLKGAQARSLQFLNGSRGYSNLLEHLPLFSLKLALAATVGQSPCVAGAALSVWSIARIFYTRGYALYGPSGRVAGFVVSLLTEGAVFGLLFWRLLRFIR